MAVQWIGEFNWFRSNGSWTTQGAVNAQSLRADIFTVMLRIEPLVPALVQLGLRIHVPRLTQAKPVPPKKKRGS